MRMAEVSVDAPFTDTIETVDQLRELYRQPSKLVAEKKLDHIPPWGRAMIGAARFVFLATADRDGRTTVSPKGGTPGFVRVLDEHHLAIPDFAGNNLLDSLENIVENPAVGLIFLMPGRPETLPRRRRRLHHHGARRARPVGGRWSAAEDGDRGARPRGLLPLPGVVPAGRAVGARRRGTPRRRSSTSSAPPCPATSGRRGRMSDDARQASVTWVLAPAGTVNVCHVDTADVGDR